MTAVEWLMDKYTAQNGVIAAADYHTAKEIEKQQIVEAHGDKYKSKSNSGSIVTYVYTYTGEMYYNEKFKK